MKIIHFSTGHLGGAGLAARRLNQALNIAGVDSSFQALSHASFVPSKYEFPLPRTLVSRLMGKFVTYLNLRIGKKVFFSLFGNSSLNLDYFSRYKDKNTILHFHNFFNLTSQGSIFALCEQGYNVVVTLHDQRLFTGGCHYTFNCTKYESVCKNCPQAPRILRPMVSKGMRHTRRLSFRNTRLFLIAPSEWMKEQADRSRLVSPEQIKFIANNLGPNFSLDTRKMGVSRDSDRFTLGIASMDLDSFIKGGDIVERLRDESKQNHLPLDFVSMKTFHGENREKEFWRSIDCLLVMSRADNSPNVIHEAKSFGIPVVANALGGITELLDSDYDYYVKDLEITSMEIQLFLQSLYSSADFDEKQLRMKNKFKDYIESSLNEHINLYRFILHSRR
jgi:glycosyltransferase involved in cell wall biosynthesis